MLVQKLNSFNSFWWRQCNGMGCISLIEKKKEKKKQTSLVLNGGNLNSERYQDEILQLVAISYFLSPGPNSVLQDDNACPHGARFIRDYFDNVGREWGGWNSFLAVMTSTPEVQAAWDAVSATATNNRPLCQDIVALLNFQYDLFL